jgi:hypothetical protein
MKVFVVQHVNETEDGNEDVKFIGVYATESDARSAIDGLKSQPGFAERPEGFCVDEYDVGKTHWPEGFVTILGE